MIAGVVGALVLVGGGSTPDEAYDLALLYAPPSPVVVVVPQASSDPLGSGKRSAEAWLERGVGGVRILERAADLEGADIVWMPGGSQFRLLDFLEDSGAKEALLEAWRGGAVVGGTSAGAAVAGEFAYAGAPDPGPYVAGAMELRPGLGLIPRAAVDQHYAERNREGRLFTALLDDRLAWAIGLDESTGALVVDGRIEAFGAGHVHVVDKVGELTFRTRLLRSGSSIAVESAFVRTRG